MPDQPALIGVGRESLSYAALAEFADELRGTLAAQDLAYPRRVAVVMPNGPEMAAAFVGLPRLRHVLRSTRLIERMS